MKWCTGGASFNMPYTPDSVYGAWCSLLNERLKGRETILPGMFGPLMEG